MQPRHFIPTSGKLILSSVIGTALLVLLMGDRAGAQNNQSDITGPNTTEPPPTIIVPPPNQPPVSPEIENREQNNENGQPQDVQEIATELSNRLQRARLACVESRQAAADLPRRFARGPGDPHVICSSLECEEFRVVTQEVQSFLNSLDNAQIQQLKQQDLQLW